MNSSDVSYVSVCKMEEIIVPFDYPVRETFFVIWWKLGVQFLWSSFCNDSKYMAGYIE